MANKDSQLIKADEATGELERSGAQAVNVNVAKSEQAVDSLISRKRSLLEKWFPSETDRQIAAGELDLVKTEFEFRNKALKLIRETQVQSLREIYNAYLKEGKAGTRARLAESLGQKRVLLEERINELSERFATTIDDATAKAQNIQNPKMRQASLDRIDESITGYHDMVSKLVKEFENIASESLK